MRWAIFIVLMAASNLAVAEEKELSAGELYWKKLEGEQEKYISTLKERLKEADKVSGISAVQRMQLHIKGLKLALSGAKQEDVEETTGYLYVRHLMTLEYAKQYTPLQHPLIYASKMRVGDMGFFGRPRSILYAEDYRFRQGLKATVLQILKEDVMLVSAAGVAFIVSGRPTGKLADDATIYLSGAFHVAKTVKYEAILGNRTSFVVQPISAESYEKPLGEARREALRKLQVSITAAEKTIADYEAAKQKAAAEAEERRAEARRHTFTDKTGKYTVRAELIGFTDNRAILRKKDGSTIRVKMQLLSKDDQDWVREELISRKRSR